MCNTNFSAFLVEYVLLLDTLIHTRVLETLSNKRSWFTNGFSFNRIFHAKQRKCIISNPKCVVEHVKRCFHSTQTSLTPFPTFQRRRQLLQLRLLSVKFAANSLITMLLSLLRCLGNETSQWEWFWNRIEMFRLLIFPLTKISVQRIRGPNSWKHQGQVVQKVITLIQD